MENKSLDEEFEDLIRRAVLEVLEKHVANRFPKILTADEIESLTEGKIKKERVYELAKDVRNNGFPLVRFGGREVKVLEDEFIRWMRNGGCPKEDKD